MGSWDQLDVAGLPTQNLFLNLPHRACALVRREAKQSWRTMVECDSSSGG